MALSEQQAPIRNLVAFKKYAKARGAKISESLPEDAPNKGVHAAKSWHYDTEVFDGVKHSKAADVNYGPAGTSAAERAVLTHLVTVAQSMGLGVVYALYGTEGSAKQHQTHLHVDVGSATNVGKGGRHATPGDLVAWDTQKILNSPQDNLAGPDTKKRLLSVYEASKRGGTDFPFGIKFTQNVLGAKPTGKWDTQSKKAHDASVKALKSLWKKAGIFKGTVDTIWDLEMDKARTRFLSRYGR